MFARKFGYKRPWNTWRRNYGGIMKSWGPRKPFRRNYSLKHVTDARTNTSTTRIRTGALRTKRIQYGGGYLRPFSLMGGSVPFPASCMRTFQICDIGGLSVTPAVTGQFGAETIYNLNSTYQPFFTGMGASRQPYGWDQAYTGVYTRYKVMRCYWELQFFNASQDNMFVAVQLSSSQDSRATNAYNPYDVMARPNAQIVVVNKTTSTGMPVCVTGYIDIWQLEGMTRDQYLADDNLYCGENNGNPTRLCYLRISNATITGDGNHNVSATVKLKYEVQLYAPVTQTYSS